MGSGVRKKKETKQLLLCGLEDCGKSKFLYEYIRKEETKTDTTVGYNYEEIKAKGVRYGIWDISGKEEMRLLWPVFYRNIKFDFIVFMVDITKLSTIRESEKCLLHLLNEDELRDIQTGVFLNNRSQPKLLKDPQVLAFKKTVSKIKKNIEIIEPSDNSRDIDDKFADFLNKQNKAKPNLEL